GARWSLLQKDLNNSFSGMAIPVRGLCGTRCTLEATTQSGNHSRRVHWWRQTIPTEFDKLHPLGSFAESYTRDAVEISLFLHAAGIRRNQSSIFFQHHHVQVSHRFDQPDAARYFPDDASIVKNPARSGMNRQYNRHFFCDLGQTAQDQAQAIKVVCVFSP